MALFEILCLCEVTGVAFVEADTEQDARQKFSDGEWADMQYDELVGWEATTVEQADDEP